MSSVRANSHKLLAFQLLAHLSIIPMIMWGSITHWLISFGIFMIISCVGITVSYHRMLTHRSFEPQTWFKYVGPIIGAYGLSGAPIGWCAIHAAHHKYVDTPEDPHSPHFKPWWWVQFFVMYAGEVTPPRHLMRSKFHQFLYVHYFKLHLAILITLLLISPFAAVYLYLMPAAILWTIENSLNWVNHSWGYRNHNTEDRSVCNPLTAFLTFGEGWHNNHHNNPRNPNFGNRWWEIDLGYQVIKLVRK